MTRKKAATIEALVGKVDGSPEGWVRILSILCRHFGLPSDLSTRSALKRIHGKLDEIYPRMAQEFERTPDVRIKGGIVDIYAKMCMDVILRNRLFGFGFLGQLLSLSAIPSCRNLALDSLVTITHHGGPEVRTEIARATCVPLLTLMKDFPEDRDTTDLALRALSHSIIGVVSNDAKQTEPALARSLPLQDVAQAFIDALHQPNPTPTLITHATTCLVEMSQDVKVSPSMSNLFLAGLRYNDWYHRSRCLSGLLITSIPQAEHDKRLMDPTSAVKCLMNIAEAPTHVRETMQTWGMNRSFMYKMAFSNREFAATMVAAYASGGSMYVAGKKIAKLILGVEMPFFDGFFPIKDPASEKVYFPGGGTSASGFQMWSDTLPLCSKAIRENGVANEYSLADILDLKFLLLRKRFPEAIALATQTTERNPDFAYGHYVLAVSQHDQHGLRAAKKGLKCTKGSMNLTRFMRLQMLQHSGQLACDIGLRALENPGRDGNPSSRVGGAFLTTAKKELQTFFAEASPDHRDFRSVCSWLIVLHVMSGEEISDDLHEIKPYVDRLNFALDFNKWLGIYSPRTQIRLVAESILQHFPAARKQWGEVVSSYDEKEPPVTDESMERDIAAWMEGLDGEDEADCCGHGHGHLHDHDGHAHAHSHSHTEEVALPEPKKDLYRCSFCHNPSAVLRKCAGCSEARYCDASCQKQHWSIHKRKCKSSKK
ncbi:SET and MYND-domain-containing protein 3 [Mycena indigotica]|uniref:SET and MYND-domain-containing protein 3 n=1 Tax=Mycena indigotica TaxID=2126181 RepID=A0A8H6T615_9AGAR|nr:SET and MYND-domain-containing protein 3 [Mycena indigotica]KAF7310075.1 SET and MYND-domain-containing protein 3 [Mycena indigotica]